MPEKFQPIPFFADPTKPSTQLRKEKEGHDEMNAKLAEEAKKQDSLQQEEQRKELEKNRTKQKDEKNSQKNADDIFVDKEMGKIYRDLDIDHQEIEKIIAQKTPEKVDSTATVQERLRRIAELKQKKQKLPTGRSFGGNTQNKQPIRFVQRRTPRHQGNRSFRRSSVIKAERVQNVNTKDKKFLSLSEKIEKDGLLAVQRQVVYTALQIIRNYFNEKATDGTIIINQKEITNFNQKEVYYKDLFTEENLRDSVKNIKEFIDYICHDLRLNNIKEVDKIIGLLEMVAELSPQSEQKSVEPAEKSESEFMNNDR